MRGKKVTQAKLIAASRAFLALSDCDDWDDVRLDDADAKIADAARRGAFPELDAMLRLEVSFWHLPDRLQLARIANTMSGMLDRFDG